MRLHSQSRKTIRTEGKKKQPKKVRLSVNINNRLTSWDIIWVRQAHYSAQVKKSSSQRSPLFSQQTLERAEQANTIPELSWQTAPQLHMFLLPLPPLWLPFHSKQLTLGSFTSRLPPLWRDCLLLMLFHAQAEKHYSMSSSLSWCFINTQDRFLEQSLSTDLARKENFHTGHVSAWLFVTLF